MRKTAPVPIPDRISGFRSGVINGILDYIESLRPIDSRTVRHEWRSDGTVSHAEGGGVNADSSAFRLVSLGDGTCTIGAGVFGIPGVYGAETAQQVVALSGDPAYVYLVHVKTSRSSYVSTTTLSTLPTSTATEYRFPLWKLAQIGATTFYQVTLDMRHGVWIGSAL